MLFCIRGTLSNAAKVFILIVLLIFSTESLEAARPMDDMMKSTPAGANKVSINPQADQGRVSVPPSSPNPCTSDIPKPGISGYCNK
ncbi:hypothetical protein FH972_002360 [Carpinus fangiana]|uniref:Uncharacterized protein n=1 Tax=Carpinus fangiana TaxID=176857 RepID=A0A5N6QEM5_9ROSI|nr:hypothetical protein FH972_002360 [Carpinus fangiana]